MRDIDEIIRRGVELGIDDGQPYIKYSEAAVDDLVALITAHTNAEIAKAKLEAFDVAFDCHDYDRLRAYRAELLKEVK